MLKELQRRTEDNFLDRTIDYQRYYASVVQVVALRIIASNETCVKLSSSRTRLSVGFPCHGKASITNRHALASKDSGN